MGDRVSRIKKALTFSNVVAVIALFLALGGSVYAASGKINGKQIKAKSLPANRIKPRSITARQIRSGAIAGSQVEAGSLTGREVVGSSLSGVSASSLGAISYASVAATLGRGGIVGPVGSAVCPAGQKVIGGGATVSNNNTAYVNESGPTPSHDGWTATGWSGSEGVTMTVTAICTPVSTTTESVTNTRSGPIYTAAR
jgi:hypothetical protein